LEVDFVARDLLEERFLPPLLVGLILPFNLDFRLEVFLGGMVIRLIVAKLMPGILGLI
jgi:hypothetical protein